MRSPREIQFRLRQEAANALLALSSPNRKLRAEAPLPLLPNPSSVADALRDTDYAGQLVRIADEVLRGRIPIFDSVIDYGDQVTWRRDPLRGTETPATYFRRIPYLDLAAAGDHKYIWEINRHQHLVRLAQAAVITGRDDCSNHVFRQLEHWWRENPLQRGINYTSALEVAFRSLSWVWIFHFIGARMPADFRQRFLAELYRHGLHLEYNLSIYFSPNTHLLGEAVALHALGRLFPEFPRAARWRSIGAEIVRGHMAACVKSDGSYFEQSTYYHVYALDMFAFHAVLDDVPASYRDSLARMAEFLAALVSDDGALPFLGDDDGGRFFHPYGARPQIARASLATASVLLGKRFFPFDERDLSEIALWWLGPERCQAPSAQGVAPQSQLFRESGIAVFRRGPVVALFDAGPFGPGGAGHSHSDTLALVVTVGATEVLIDSGTYSYMDPDERGCFRGSAAHNTIRIDSHDQAVAAGPFRWQQKPEVKLLDFVADSAKHSATASCSHQGFTHQRTVEFVGSEISILDQITGPAGEHNIEQFWHFAIEPRETAPGRWTIGDVAELFADGGVVEPAWRSRCFGSREPAWAVVIRRRASQPLSLTARLRISDPLP